MGDNPLTSDASLVRHYAFLKEIGIIDRIEELKKSIEYKDELLNEAAEIFNKQSIPELIRYIPLRFLDKFVPGFLLFVTQEELDANHATIQCFKNLKPAESDVTIRSFLPYKQYFRLAPRTTSFEVFEYLVDNREITDVFLPLQPELVVPMMGLDGVYGFIIFGKKVVAEPYTKDEMKYIDILMKFASVCLQNNIHYRRSTLDLKTRVYNHSYFMIRLEEEMARIRRHRSMISILLLDIDNFKKFNDAYGHLAGDDMLAHVSGILSGNIRSEDVVARFGGEEFIVMLIQCPEQNALAVGNRMREQIENANLDVNGKLCNVTVSIGISFGSNQFTGRGDDLVRQADIALYRSKTEGRNRCTVYTESLGMEKNA